MAPLPMRPSCQPAPSPRGIYRAWFLSTDGHPVFHAISADGRCVDYGILTPGTDRPTLEATLAATLDRADPLPPADAAPRRASRPVQLVRD